MKIDLNTNHPGGGQGQGLVLVLVIRVPVNQYEELHSSYCKEVSADHWMENLCMILYHNVFYQDNYIAQQMKRANIG